jgi:hypothetical protein
VLLGLPRLRDLQIFEGSLADRSVAEALAARGLRVKIYR